MDMLKDFLEVLLEHRSDCSDDPCPLGFQDDLADAIDDGVDGAADNSSAHEVLETEPGTVVVDLDGRITDIQDGLARGKRHAGDSGDGETLESDLEHSVPGHRDEAQGCAGQLIVTLQG